MTILETLIGIVLALGLVYFAWAIVALQWRGITRFGRTRRKP